MDGKWHYWGFIDDAFKCPVSAGVQSQQFTGLLSKSGQEIYEGDIGKLGLDRIIPLYVVCVVEWSVESASFHWKTVQVINMTNTGWGDPPHFYTQHPRAFMVFGSAAYGYARELWVGRVEASGPIVVGSQPYRRTQGPCQTRP